MTTVLTMTSWWSVLVALCVLELATASNSSDPFIELTTASNSSDPYNELTTASNSSDSYNELTTASNSSDSYTLDVRLDKAVSSAPDELICSWVKVPHGETDSYITAVTPRTTKATTHHMQLYGCPEPATTEKLWRCNPYKNESVCKNDDEQKNLWAWALDAPGKDLPDGTGFWIGGNTGIRYLIVQLHYNRKFEDGLTDSSGYTLTLTKQRPEQQISYIVLASGGSIPPQLAEYHMESYLVYNRSYEVYPIAFRTHSHNLGVVTSGYRVRNGTWTEIGRDSPQLPQAFYNITNPGMDIRPGDTLTARCTMDSMNRTEVTYTGPRNWDEMCNFYIMYSTHYWGVLGDEIGFNDAPEFNWTQIFSPEEIPQASSLTGIPGEEFVRNKYNLTQGQGQGGY